MAYDMCTTCGESLRYEPFTGRSEAMDWEEDSTFCSIPCSREDESDNNKHILPVE